MQCVRRSINCAEAVSTAPGRRLRYTQWSWVRFKLVGGSRRTKATGKRGSRFLFLIKMRLKFMKEKKSYNSIILFYFLHSFSQSQSSASNHNLRVIEKSDVEMILDDWQTLTLALASCACLLFFIVAACMFWQHTRYWKKMERMEREYNAGLLPSVCFCRFSKSLQKRKNEEKKNRENMQVREDRLTEIQSSNLLCIQFSNCSVFLHAVFAVVAVNQFVIYIFV